MVYGFNATLVEVLTIIALGVLSLGLTAVGLMIEFLAATHLLAGEQFLGLWEGAVGLIVLYVAVYGIGHQKLLPKLRQLERTN